MARVRAHVVHDELGNIVSVARPAQGVNVVISTSDGQAVMETEIDEDAVYELVDGSHRVDAQARAIVTNAGPGATSG
jgi:type 1 fimbria pilin